MNNTTHGKILLVACDPSAWQEVCATLRRSGFSIEHASTAGEAMMRLRNAEYDIAVLDFDRSDREQSDVCRRISQEFPALWVLAAGSDDSVQWRIGMFEAGADHFIARPFDAYELRARLRAMTRRSRLAMKAPKAPISIGMFHLDLSKRILTKAGREIRLSAIEFKLLYQLMACAGQPVLHSSLLDIVWGRHSAKEQSYLRIYISQLRKKLEPVPGNPRFLLTYSAVGYSFASPASIAEVS